MDVETVKLTIRYEKSEKVDESLSNTDKVLKLIDDNPKITANEMAIILSVSTRTVERIFTKLQKNKIIVRYGSDKSGEWKIMSV